MITFGRIYKMKKLLGILVLGLLWSNVGSAGLTYMELYGCKDPIACLKKWCPGDEFNDGKKCYKLNDFLSQGYEITNEKHGEHSNITYSLFKKSWFGSDKLIICKVHANIKKTRCHKP